MYQSLYDNKRPPSPAPVTPDLWQHRSARRPRGRRDRRYPLFVSCIALLLAASMVCTLVLGAVGPAFRNWGHRVPGEEYGGEYDWSAGYSSAQTALPVCTPRLDLRLTLEEPAQVPLTYQEIYRQVLPSIVGIRSWDGEGSYTGTGLVLAEDGYILTNDHVIAGCHRAAVVLPDGGARTAQLVGRDSRADLAVLKIEADGLPPIRFGQSDRLEVGDSALAIGNPLGEEFWGTMTEGIISAIDRDVAVDGQVMTLIQTTAAINSGNSGGALVNQYGQVVGITNLKMVSDTLDDSLEGLGFAIPSTTVREMVHQFVADGNPTAARIGVTVRPLTDREREETGLSYGLLVVEVEPECPAAERIFPGDVLLTANGEELLASSDLLLLRASLRPGGAIQFLLARGDELRSETVALYAGED